MLKKIANQLLKHVVDRMKKDDHPFLDHLAQNNIESYPELVHDFLDMLVTYHEDKEEQTQFEYQAALSLFTDGLVRLRFAIDKQRQWAVELSGRVQHKVSEDVFIPEVDQSLQNDILDALKDSGLEITQELKEANVKLMEYYNRFWQKGNPDDFEAVIDAMDLSRLGDVYDIASVFLPQLELIPHTEDQLVILRYLACSRQEKLREMVGLMLLHPEQEVRRLVPEILMENVSNVDPQTLCRMIALRNWLPEEERPALDRAIRAVRIARIPCATMPAHPIAALSASGIDGSGSQILWLAIDMDGSWLVGQVLVEIGHGVRGVWCQLVEGDNLPEDVFAFPEGEIPIQEMNEDYLEPILVHHIAECHLRGEPPPFELLRIAEALGGMHWSPKLIDHEFVAEGYQETKDPQKLAKLSRQWGLVDGYGLYWFEDDENVDRVLQQHFLDGASLDSSNTMDVIFEKVLEPRRQRWVQCFMSVAFWLKCGAAEVNPVWERFYGLSRMMEKGFPLKDISIMEHIAHQTIVAGLSRLERIPPNDSYGM